MAARMNKFADMFCTKPVANSEEEEAVCRIQANIRGFLIRRKFQQIRKLYEEIVTDVEGDLDVSSKHGTVHWKTHLPCRPMILMNPSKLPSVEQRRIQAIASQISSTDLEGGNAASQQAPDSSRSKDSISEAGVRGQDEDHMSEPGSDYLQRTGDSYGELAARISLSGSQDTSSYSPTPSQHQTLSKESNSSDSCKDESKSQNGRAVQLDSTRALQPNQISTSSEKVEPFEESGVCSKLLSASSSNHDNRQDSPASSVEYTMDFESCSSTTASHRPDSDREEEKGVVLKNPDAAVSINAIADSQAILTPDGMRSREEDSSEGASLQDEGESVEHLPSLIRDSEPSAGRNDAEPPSREDDRTPEDLLHPCQAPAMSNRTDSLSEAEEKHLLSDTATGAQGPLQNNPGMQSSFRDEGSINEDQAEPCPNGLLQEGQDSPGERTDTAAPSSDQPAISGCRGDGEGGGEETWRAPSRDKGGHEWDTFAAADMTSIWSHEDTVAEMKEEDYPSGIAELEAMRSGVAMEIMWIQQAIDSRKKYLRLKNNIQTT